MVEHITTSSSSRLVRCNEEVTSNAKASVRGGRGLAPTEDVGVRVVDGVGEREGVIEAVGDVESVDVGEDEGVGDGVDVLVGV